MKKFLFAAAIFYLAITFPAFSQSLSINTDGSTANASAMLDIKSTTKGLLIPRMSRTERNAIAAPATGLMIFQNSPDSIGLYYYNGSAWTWLFSNSNSDSLAWKTGGNTGTVDGTNFIGTKDNIPLTIKVNNLQAGRIDHIKSNTFWGYRAGLSNTTGVGNTANGSVALFSNTTGSSNTATGGGALLNNTIGNYNTANGSIALQSNTTGSYNTANGYQALQGNTTGSSNTANGYQALQFNTTGTSNTANGVIALLSNTTGQLNTANGYSALLSNTTGVYNTANGASALQGNTTGNQNTATGFSSLYNNTNGVYNTANGVDALKFNTTGQQNTADGANALLSNTTGINNTANGFQALQGNTNGNNNTAVGYYASGLSTTGYSNVAVGARALYTNISTSNLVAVGDSSMYNNTGVSNTAIGSKSLYSNTTAGKNTAIGYQALYSQSFSNGSTAWSSENIAIGDSTLYANQPTTTTNAYHNTAVGNRSLRTNTTGYQNTATGSLALYSNTTGWLNTANGWASLYKNNTGQYNAAGGTMAMYYNTTGSYNTAFGAQALHNNVTGSNNTVIGNDAGLGVLNNSYANNTIMGYQSGYGLTTGSNNVFLGYRAGYGETTGSNKLFIANSSTNPPLIYGDFSAATVGLGTITPAEKLEINGNLKFTVGSTIYSNTGTALTIRPGDGTGSGGALTIRGGNAGIASGGAGGDLNLTAGANLPAGGMGYVGLGVPGVLNITGSYGYNSVGGAVNITAGATSCWSLVSGSHSDVNITGGTNLAVTDASSIVVEGGYTIGTSCPPPGATGGNLILKSGIASGTGTAGNIQLLNGNVGVGCTAPAYKLHVIGDIASSATVRSTNVVVTGAITACSDGRFKTNIMALNNPMQKLMLLNGVNYYWKTTEYPNMNFSDRKQIGFIAQDLEKIFPEMVFTDEKGYKSVDYSRLTPVLVETIKAQQQQITDITRRLQEIEKLLIK